jgi:hypothetical protein
MLANCVWFYLTRSRAGVAYPNSIATFCCSRYVRQEAEAARLVRYSSCRWSSGLCLVACDDIVVAIVRHRGLLKRVSACVSRSLVCDLNSSLHSERQSQ